MKLALIYDKNDKGLSGRWYCNNSYRFFMKGLFENPRISVMRIPFKNEVNCLDLTGFDVLLFYNIFKGRYKNVSKVKSLKIARAPDSHDMNAKWNSLCRSFGITHVFNHQTEVYARKYLHDSISYYQIIFGIDKKLYTNTPYPPRRKDKILLPGVINTSRFYVLREKCSKLGCVEHIDRNLRFEGDKFPELLKQYRAAIAACTVCSVYKYFEIPACGCLTFMEVTTENGCDRLGFIDGQNAIFIDQNNYVSKMKHFLRTPDDPKWNRIASEGSEFVLSKYANDIQVDKLVDLIYEWV